MLGQAGAKIEYVLYSYIFFTRATHKMLAFLCRCSQTGYDSFEVRRLG